MYIIYLQGRKYISIQSMLHLHVHTRHGTQAIDRHVDLLDTW